MNRTMGGELLNTHDKSTSVELDYSEAKVLKKCIDSVYRTYSGRIGHEASTLKSLKTSKYPFPNLEARVAEIESAIVGMEAIRIRLKILSNKLVVVKE